MVHNQPAGLGRWCVAVCAALLASCQSVESPSEELGGQSGSLRDELPLPDDVGTVDMEAAVNEALSMLIEANLDTLWGAHLATLALGDGACPPIYLGAPEDAQVGNDAPGVSWVASCGSGDLDYSGFLYWESAVEADGATATRLLSGDGVVSSSSGTLLSFEGEASDSVSFTGSDWSYTSTLIGAFEGSSAFGPESAVPGGFRGEVNSTYASDGALSLDAHVYLYGEPLQGRFDSVVADLVLSADCPDEPVGYVGLRGTDGYWFDVFFLPIYPEDDESAHAQSFPYELMDDMSCDGCGTLFVRNTLPENLGPVCPDFAGVVGELKPPALEDYILTLHDPPWESP